MKYSKNAAKDAWSTSANEAQRAQEKAFAIGRESAEHLARSADVATRSINEAVQLSQENLEACIECGNMAVDVSKTISEEIFNFTNNLFAQNVEISKQAFTCRTLNDVFDLHSKLFRANVDELFGESAKVSELWFEMANKITEPLTERLTDAAERWTKTIAA